MDKRHQLCVKSWLHGTYSPASLLLKATTHHITHKYGLQIKKGRDKQSKTILKMKRYDTLKEEKTGYLDAWWITTTNGMWNEVSETGQWYDWHASLSSETHCPIPLWLNRPLKTAQEDLFVFWFMKWAECNQAIKTIVLKEIVCEGVILRTDIANMWNKQLNCTWIWLFSQMMFTHFNNPVPTSSEITNVMPIQGTNNMTWSKPHLHT